MSGIKAPNTIQLDYDGTLKLPAPQETPPFYDIRFPMHTKKESGTSVDKTCTCYLTQVESAGRKQAHGVESLGPDMNALLSLESKIQLEFKSFILF